MIADHLQTDSRSTHYEFFEKFFLEKFPSLSNLYFGHTAFKQLLEEGMALFHNYLIPPISFSNVFHPNHLRILNKYTDLDRNPYPEVTLIP